MKKYLSLLLYSCFLFSFTACSLLSGDTADTVSDTLPNTDIKGTDTSPSGTPNTNETESNETGSDEKNIGDELSLNSLSLDNGTVLNPQEKSRTYTVLLPDGRPRVPRIQAEAKSADAVVKIYNPMFAQDEAEAVGKVELSLDGQSVSWNIIFKKDKANGFVLQYDDRYTFVPDSGENKGGKLTFSSSDEKIISVSASGELTVKGVSKTPITVNALYNGTVCDSLTVDRTEKAQINIFLITGQSNASGTYDAGLDTNAEFLQSRVCTPGSVYCADVENNGSIGKMYDLSQGRIGFSPSLGAEWYRLTGEKSLMLQSAFPGSPIEAWEKNGTGYAGGTNLYNNTLHAYEYYRKLLNNDESDYEIIRVGYFWCQGETAEKASWTGSGWDFSGKYIMPADTYYKKFSKIHSDFVKDMDTEFASIMIVRAVPGVVLPESEKSQYLTDLVAPRVAQYALHSNNDLSITVQSRLGEISRPATAPDKTSPGYAYSGPQNVHYTQKGYNAQGIELAKNTVATLSADTDKTPQSLEVIAYDGRTRIQNGDSIPVDIAAGTQIVGVVLPMITDIRGVSYSVVEGKNIVSVDSFGKITVLDGAKPDDTAKIRVASDAGFETVFNAVIVPSPEPVEAPTVETQEFVWNFNNMEEDGLTLTELSDANGFSYANGQMTKTDKTSDFTLSTPFMLADTFDWSIEYRACCNDNSSLFGANCSGNDFIYLAYKVGVWNCPFRMVSHEGAAQHIPYGSYASKNAEMNTWRVLYEKATKTMTLYFKNGDNWETVGSAKWDTAFTFHITNMFGRYGDLNVHVCFCGEIDYIIVNAVADK